MSIVIPDFRDTVIVRGARAEVVGTSTAKVQLLADSNATGGALSTVRVSLDKGADGARPHHHKRSAEMFYIIDGAVRLLSGDQIVHADAGDVIVVPPNVAHAFAAEPGKHAELLIVIAPGVERFEYFRKLTRIARAEEPPETLGEVQNLYDNYFINSPEWEAASKKS
jgi:quercetin dioxygenase-like cupin family protein